MATFHGKERGEVRNRMGKEKVRRDEELRMYLDIVTGKQIGRASCRERVSSPV